MDREKQRGVLDGKGGSGGRREGGRHEGRETKLKERGRQWGREKMTRGRGR